MIWAHGQVAASTTVYTIKLICPLRGAMLYEWVYLLFEFVKTSSTGPIGPKRKSNACSMISGESQVAIQHYTICWVLNWQLHSHHTGIFLISEKFQRKPCLLWNFFSSIIVAEIACGGCGNNPTCWYCHRQSLTSILKTVIYCAVPISNK